MYDNFPFQESSALQTRLNGEHKIFSLYRKYKECSVGRKHFLSQGCLKLVFSFFLCYREEKCLFCGSTYMTVHGELCL